MILFGEKGVPIICLTNIKALAHRYGMPIAPHPLPEPPAGGIFFEKHYRTDLVTAMLAFYAALTFFVIRIDVREYLRRRRRRS